MTVSSLAARARVRHAGDARDLDARRAGRAAFMRALGRRSRRPGPARTRATAAAAGGGVRRAARAPGVRLHHVRQRRGVRRAGAGAGHPRAVDVRAPPAPVRRTRARRVPAGRADRGALQARAHGRPLRTTSADPGAAHHPDRRRARRTAGAPRRRRGDRGGAHLHDAARERGPRAPRPRRRRCAATCARTPPLVRSSWHWSTPGRCGRWLAGIRRALLGDPRRVAGPAYTPSCATSSA